MDIDCIIFHDIGPPGLGVKSLPGISPRTAQPVDSIRNPIHLFPHFPSPRGRTTAFIATGEPQALEVKHG
jgi:hypothetical protein